ncbi:MAG: hypothetical protein KAI47_19475, partial [Deltaproteobacteria bacterium]|nr:hypothetical protein [Deltaproteobacteria bacterium]
SFGDTRGFLGGGGSVVLAALPLGPLLFDGTISLDGLGLLGEPWAPSYAGQSDRDGLLWQVAPTLTLARMVGPLAIDGRVGYRLRGLWTEVDDLRGEQALGARLTAGVPVSRYFGERSLEHRIEPFLGVAETAGESLSHAFFSALPLARLSLFEAGIVSSLARVSSGREILHLRLRGLYEARSERWLATGTFTLNHQLGEVAFRGVYDLSRSRVAWAEARACGRPLARLQICAGYLRQGLEELWPLFAMETGLPSAVAFPDALVDRVDGSVAWGLGPFRVDVHVRVDPIRGVMTHADYAARYESPCRCFSVGVVGRSYRGRAMPDVLLRVTLAPGPLGACLRALVP